MLTQGQMRFRDTFTLNMYYSTTRRGNLHPSIGGDQDVMAVPEASTPAACMNDWTCVKVSYLGVAKVSSITCGRFSRLSEL